MKKYLAPLYTFVGGQVLILILFLFFPYIATRLAALWAAGDWSNLWGFEWVVLSGRLIIVVIAELLTLFITALEFWRIKDQPY